MENPRTLYERTPPGSIWTDDTSRPVSPDIKMGPRRAFSDHTMPIQVPFDANKGDIGYGRGPLYGHRNDSETHLVSGAAEMPVTTTENPHGRDDSQERRAPGFLGGGPRGYGGLPQAEEDVDGEPTSYDYFRSRRQPDIYRGAEAS